MTSDASAIRAPVATTAAPPLSQPGSTTSVVSTTTAIAPPGTTTTIYPAEGVGFGDQWVEYPLGWYERSVWLDGVEVLLFTHEVASLPRHVEPSREDLLVVVDRLYGTFWGGEEVREPEERPVGALPGVLAGWVSPEEGPGVFTAVSVFFAADDTWLYAVPITVQGEPAAPADLDAFMAETEALADRVAQLPTPITGPVPAYPAATEDWRLESGDILVAAEDGLHVLRRRGDGWGPRHTIIAEPMDRVTSDGGTGLVYQLSARYRKSEPIWWLPGPGAEPVMVADIEPTTYPYYAPYDPLELIDVATIDGERRVLYTRFDTDGRGDHLLYSYSLDTGDTVAVIGTRHPEVGIDCVAWTGDGYVITSSPEGNASIRAVVDGEWLDGGLDVGNGSVCVAPDSEGTVVAAYRTFDESTGLCTEVVDQVIGRLDLDSWALDPVHDLGAPIEHCVVEALDGDGDAALVYTRHSRFETGGSTRLIDLSTGQATELPINGVAAFVP